MKPGKLDQLLDIYRPVTETTASGARRPGFERVNRVHAQLVTSRGFRRDEASEHFADHTATFYIRYGVTVGENWRLNHVGGFEYVITSVEANRRRGLKILTCERLNK